MAFHCSSAVLLLVVKISFFVGVVTPITAETLISDFAHQYDDLEHDYDNRLVVISGEDVINSTQTKTGHCRNITLVVTAFNKTFILDLKLNVYLFSTNYIEKAITKSSEVYNKVDQITSHCYYIGHVRDIEQSFAAVSTCKGINGYFKIDSKKSYHIEPQNADLTGAHRISRSRTNFNTQFKCDVGKTSLNRLDVSDMLVHFSRRVKRSFLWPQNLDKKTKVLELYVANDRSQYLSLFSNVDSVYSRTKDIVNIASAAYQVLDIYLVLVGVEVWTDSNQIPVNDSAMDATLNSWEIYRMINITPFHYNDNAILITNLIYDGGIAGKAPEGTMCSNRYSAAMVSDIFYPASAAASTMDHELGHNFGLLHDNGCPCNDSSTGNICIMNSDASSLVPATKWSACSVTQMNISLSHGLDICLYDVPTTIFQPSATCGNGIVEDGEQCDCGNVPSSECNQICCNSTTCQLVAPALCAAGRCCDISTCQIKPSGTICRPIANDCDLAEYCTGVDSLCPPDSYKPDGTDCVNLDPAYCYQGQCRSHRSQCELLWGPGTNASDSSCYNTYNVRGVSYGNCGIAWNSSQVVYLPCQASDVMCGRLQCQNNSKTLYYYQNFIAMATATTGSSTCHTVVFDFGIRIQDPGLVPNGAKCGDNQMCVNQQCVNMTTILPATTTGMPSATDPSTTASVATSSLSTWEIILIAVLTSGLLIVLLILAIVCFCLYRYYNSEYGRYPQGNAAVSGNTIAQPSTVGGNGISLTNVKSDEYKVTPPIRSDPLPLVTTIVIESRDSNHMVSNGNRSQQAYNKYGQRLYVASADI